MSWKSPNLYIKFTSPKTLFIKVINVTEALKTSNIKTVLFILRTTDIEGRQ
jgi:hypothetical protein